MAKFCYKTKDSIAQVDTAKFTTSLAPVKVI